jgi:hypothetical protein
LAAAAIPAATTVAGAVDQAPTEPPNLATCTKAVNVLGATMSHSEFKDADGRTKYRFTLRTSGLDYDAICDAATGVIGDVTPHRAPSSDAAG